MNDITIILPLHIFNDEVKPLLDNALNSVNECAKLYKHGKLTVLFSVAKEIETEFLPYMSNLLTYSSVGKFDVFVNEGDTDFCSQVNGAVDKVDTDFFSILEFDDEYTPKWFNMAHDYYYGNETVSAFLPVNLTHDDSGKWGYSNEMALSPAFITPDANDKDDVGIINRLRLEHCSLFNLTGAIINTQDFIKCGKYKPSIKAAFNYELLLRMTGKFELKAMVVPKEGYIHHLGRVGSLTDEYKKTLSVDEVNKWFGLALRENIHVEDRKKDISTIKEEEVK